jgi:uncharacterized protein (TIGR02117 family)
MIDRMQWNASTLRRLRGLALVLACALAGCAAPATRDCPVPPGQPADAIYVVSHGWHAGIVLPGPAVAGWPLSRDAPAAQHVEVGWGERDFYMLPDPGWWLAIEGVLVPNQSVLHVVWLDAPVGEFFRGSAIYEIRLTPEAMERLSRYIAGTFAHASHDGGIDLGPGLYGSSRFYLSRERYHAFNTCNAWVARALREAGCPINPAFALTVDELLRRVRPFATPIPRDGG